MKIQCPACSRVLWVDAGGRVIRHEKDPQRRPPDLKELMVREKKKKEAVDQTFLSARKIEQKKKEEAEKLFQKAFNNGNSEESGNSNTGD